MLKKMSRYFILAMIQLAFLVIILFFLTPILLESISPRTGLAYALDKTRMISFLIRILVYASIFYGWPYVIKQSIRIKTFNLVNKLNQARFLFIGALLLIELFYWVGKL